MGDEKFVDKITQKLNWIEKPLKKPPLDKIINLVSKASGVSFEDILSFQRRSKIRNARSILIKVCQQAGYKLTELQPGLKRDLSALSRWSREAEKSECQQLIEEVRRSLNA